MNGPTLFDVAEPLNPPRFEEGDDVYEVVLDVLLHYKVSGTFSVGVDMSGDKAQAGHTLWRYHLDRVDTGMHATFGEYEVGAVWFSSHSQAAKLASYNRDVIESAGRVVRAADLSPTQYVAYSLKGPGGRAMPCQVARLDPYRVFSQKPCSYPFIEVFDSEKEASRFYNSYVEGLMAENGVRACFQPRDMYRVNDGLWSGYEYAARHGDWGILENPVGQNTKAEQGMDKGGSEQKAKRQRGYAR